MKPTRIYFFGCLSILIVSLLLVLYSSKKSSFYENVSKRRELQGCLLLIGAGNVGYPLLQKLTSSSFKKYIVLDLEINKEEIESAKRYAQVEFVEGDMRNLDLLENILKTNDVNGIIVLAAVSRVIWCENAKDVCQDVNTNAIQLLVNAIDKSNSNPWLLFASSREVYGAVKQFPITEDTEMNPLNLYGKTKMDGENIIMSYNRKHLNKIILRFSSIYGGKYDHSDRLIPAMVRAMLSDQPIPLSGGNQEFDFTYIDDVVQAVLLAVLRLEQARGSLTRISDKFNICSGEQTSVSKLFQILQKITNSLSPTLILENNGVFPDKYEASTEKSSKILGFKAEFMIKEGLQKYIRELQTESLKKISNRFQKSLSIHEDYVLQSLNNCTVVVESNGNLPYPAARSEVLSTVQNNKLKLSNIDQEFLMKLDPFTRSLAFLNSDQSEYYDMEKKSFLSWDKQTFPLKLHVHCCPNVKDHPLSEYSPYYMTNFKSSRQKTSFNQKLEESISYKKKHLGFLSPQNYINVNTKEDLLQIIKTSSSENPKAWAQYSKGQCESDCGNVITCMKSENCRCVINEHCSHSAMKIPTIISSSPKFDIRTKVLSAYGKILGKRWPKVHVRDYAQNQQYLNKKECVDVFGTNCFSMDASIYLSFKTISVPLEEADVVLFPHFQGCTIHFFGDQSGSQINGYILSDMNEIKKTYPKKMFVTLASHDYGGCDRYFETYYEAGDISQREGYSNAVSIQPNGDFFSNCYIPSKDIVAPPRTCLTNKLIDRFSSNVKNVLERKHLVFFEGSSFGTGETVRKKIKECESIFGYKPKNQYSDYLDMLAETKFCPLIGGTTGWATRNSDVIYAGCIPVYVTEYTHQPFSTLLDYSKFSVRIHPSELFNLNNILESISKERLIELQGNLLLVRDLMIYKNPTTVQEWSPQDMVLRELFFKLHTFYPK